LNLLIAFLKKYFEIFYHIARKFARLIVFSRARKCREKRALKRKTRQKRKNIDFFAQSP